MNFHLMFTSRDKCSQAFPGFPRSSASVYYTERKPKNKKTGEAWERGYERGTCRPRCDTGSPTTQDVFRPLLGLISYVRTTRRWELLPHARSALNGRHCLYVHVHDATQALLHVSKRGLSANSNTLFYR